MSWLSKISPRSVRRTSMPGRLVIGSIGGRRRMPARAAAAIADAVSEAAPASSAQPSPATSHRPNEPNAPIAIVAPQISATPATDPAVDIDFVTRIGLDIRPARADS